MKWMFIIIEILLILLSAIGYIIYYIHVNKKIKVQKNNEFKIEKDQKIFSAKLFIKCLFAILLIVGMVLLRMGISK